MPDVMKTVGRYEILREVGRGGMAMVYLARQTDLDRFVALKELGAFHASDPSFAQRFLRESRVAGSLSHPNIVTVHDYFDHDGTPYIAMEYVERGSLRPYVGKLTLAQIGGVLEGLLAGLTHAESHGIVHRDLKPENLMVTADGRVKIADFGIAKATTKMQTGAFLTATGTTVGTPTYMAPEQAMAQDIGPWTDLYSVGCMAFEIFTGNVPFHDSDAPMAILLRHVNEPIAPVKSIVPEVDPRVSDWIEQLLVKDPEQRTRNAQDAWDDFEEILISLLGPRWRREARLVERVDADHPAGAKPLTPAPFQGTSVGDGEASQEFKSFAWGAPAADTGTPPMWTPPPSQSAPSIPEPVVGPATPMPSQAIPAPTAEPDYEPTGATDFVTFGVPAPAPPTDALIVPPVEEPKTSEPVVTPPPVEAVALDPHDTLRPTKPPPARPAPPAPSPAALRARQRPPHDDAPPPAAAGGRPPPRGTPPAAIVGGVVVVGAVAALALGGGGGDKPAPTPTPTAAKRVAAAAVPISANGVSLKVPAGWSQGGTVAIPGLAGGAVTVGGPKGGKVVVGRGDASAANATLLADGLRKAAGSPLPAKQTVNLSAGVQAARYDKLPIGHGQTATVFAIPTTKGVTTLACLADDATCATIASSLRVTSGKPFPVGPSSAYAQRVERSLAKLESSEKSAATALSHASRRQSQVAATKRLASAYRGAAGKLRKSQVSPADKQLNRELVSALGATATAYTKAAADGAHKDRGGYGREGAKALAAGKAIGAKLNALNAAGYAIPAGTVGKAAAATKLPTLKKDPVKHRQVVVSAPVQTQTVTPTQTQTQTQTTTQTPTNTAPAQQVPPTHTAPPKHTPTHTGSGGLSGGGEG